MYNFGLGVNVIRLIAFVTYHTKELECFSSNPFYPSLIIAGEAIVLTETKHLYQSKNISVYHAQSRPFTN
jgi:hypothetical protein